MERVLSRKRLDHISQEDDEQGVIIFKSFYCYTWVAVIALNVFDQIRLSYFVTFSNVCGTIVGEFLGEFIRKQRMNRITTDMTVDEIELRRLHFGVFIWFINLSPF